MDNKNEIVTKYEENMASYANNIAYYVENKYD